MPTVNVIAIKDRLPFFQKGQEMKIVPILYEEDTLIRDEIYGIFKDGVMMKICEQRDLQYKIFQDCKIIKICEKLYAPKGSYKNSYIELKDGRQLPSSICKNYQEYFKKI